MRILGAITLMLSVALAQAGTLHPTLQAELCRAAVEESAMPSQVNALLEAKMITFEQGPEILAVNCGGKSLLEVLVEQQQAENLEYLVIDLGVNADQPLVQVAGQQVSVSQLLQIKARSGSAGQRAFAQEYLELFADADFNPSLWISMQ